MNTQFMVSIRTDRMLVMELGVNVVVYISPQEVAALIAYLERHKLFFQVRP